MIDHVMLYVRDYERSKRFYLAALKPLGYEVFQEFGTGIGLGAGGKPDFWFAGGDHEPGCDRALDTRPFAHGRPPGEHQAHHGGGDDRRHRVDHDRHQRNGD